MANIQQSKKRARQDLKKKIVNRRNLSIVKTSIKKFLKFINNNEYAAAVEFYPFLTAKIDKSVAKGIFHKNKASRLKSRFNKKIKIK